MPKFRFRSLAAGVLVLAVGLAGCSSSKSESPAQASAEITTAWQTFFSASGGPDLVQGMTPTLAKSFNKAARPAALTAKVKSVQLLGSSECSTNAVPAPCATVTYDLVNGSTVLLGGSKGYATRVKGKWLVSKATFCSLEALGNGNKPPAGC